MKEHQIIKEKGNKEQSVGEEKVGARCLPSHVPCPSGPTTRSLFKHRLLIPLPILQRRQDSRELPVLSQTLAFFSYSYSRLLNPALTKQALPHARRPCLLRDTEVLLLKVFWALHPPRDP